MKTIEIVKGSVVRNRNFQLLFIFAAAVFTSTVLLFYSRLLKDLIPSSNLVREYCICFGQIIFQSFLLFIFKKNRQIAFDYVNQMMIVSFIGACLLVPVLISSLLFFPFSPGVYYYLTYFFIVVIFMFFNQAKRIKNIHAPFWLTYTWVLYRVLVLLIILN